MFNKIHTYIFLISLVSYLCIGFYTIIIQSVIAGFFYLIILVIDSLIMAYFCCTKCKFNKTACRHIVPGKLTKYLPEPKSKEFKIYKTNLSLYLTTAIIIIIPQYWLWNFKYLFVFFWILVIINIIENTIIIKSHHKD